MFQSVVAPPVVCCESLEPRRMFASKLPAFDHIVVVIEENHDYADIAANTSARFLRGLIRHGSSLPHAHGVVPHGSLPNYLALFSGSTQGVSVDDDVDSQFDATSLGGQLRAAGYSFAGYSEDLPETGFTGQSS